MICIYTEKGGLLQKLRFVSILSTFINLYHIHEETMYEIHCELTLAFHQDMIANHNVATVKEGF